MTASQSKKSALTQNFEEMRDQIESHIAADEVVKGQYYHEGKGCFIGCLSHSDDPLDAVEKFGLTVHLLRIAESIFEALPTDEAIAFFASFPEAIGCNNKDLSLVHWQFLRDELKLLPDKTPYIQSVIEGMTLLSSGDDWPAAHAHAAANAAYAAYAYATYADAFVVDDDDAAVVANAARVAADANNTAVSKNQAKRLLKLIANAPIRG